MYRCSAITRKNNSKGNGNDKEKQQQQRKTTIAGTVTWHKEIQQDSNMENAPC